MPNPPIGEWVDCPDCDYSASCKLYAEIKKESDKSKNFCQQRCK